MATSTRDNRPYVSDELKIGLGIAAAIVAAVASLIVALMNRKTTLETHKSSRNHDKELRQLEATLKKSQSEFESRLGTMGTEFKARTDYEYKARMRLYEEYEPLLFQLVETSEAALFRISSMARSARIGDLRRDGRGFLEGGYYLISTIYLLLSPLVIFAIIRRRLTLIDLTVNPRITTEYQYAKRLYFLLSQDFEFAKEEPWLEYEPFAEDWEDLRRRDPARYWRQGAPIGAIDNAAEALIVDDGSNLRRMTLGEFQRTLDDRAGDMASNMGAFFDLFVGFHPATRPVLWRILVAKAHFYRWFVLAGQARVSVDPPPVSEPWDVFPANRRSLLDWRTDSERGLVDVSPDQSCDVARRRIMTPPDVLS